MNALTPSFTHRNWLQTHNLNSTSSLRLTTGSHPSSFSLSQLSSVSQEKGESTPPLTTQDLIANDGFNPQNGHSVNNLSRLEREELLYLRNLCGVRGQVVKRQGWVGFGMAVHKVKGEKGGKKKENGDDKGIVIGRSRKRVESNISEVYGSPMEMEGVVGDEGFMQNTSD